MSLVSKDAETKLWVEKYRPTTLDDLVGNEYTLQFLKNIVKHGNMPNLILAGSSGTGKTSSIYALAHSLLRGGSHSQTEQTGAEERSFAKESLLELNASDDRGIDTVRESIKKFCQKKTTLPEGRHKIIILDEADSLTPQAQQAMRRTMELFSKTTRFAFSCNDSSKIIEAIQSRCTILKYSRLSPEQVRGKIELIVHAEGLSSTKEGIDAIVDTSTGDLRKAIGTLHSTSFLGAITEKNVYGICNRPLPETIDTLLQNCLKGNSQEASMAIKNLYLDGYSANCIIESLFASVKRLKIPLSVKPNSELAKGTTKKEISGLVKRSAEEITEFHRIQIIDAIGNILLRISEGASSLLQLEALLCRIILIVHSTLA